MTDLVLNVWWHGLLYEHAVWTKDAHWDGEKWHGLVEHCRIAHSFEFDERQLGHPDIPRDDFLDCPVASRWTLVRAK